MLEQRFIFGMDDARGSANARRELGNLVKTLLEVALPSMATMIRLYMVNPFKPVG